MKVHNQSYRPVSTAGDEFVAGKPAAIGDEEKRRVIRVDDIKVEGRIHKPQAFYILPRAPLRADFVKDLSRSWLPRINEALDDPIFQKK